MLSDFPQYGTFVTVGMLGWAQSQLGLNPAYTAIRFEVILPSALRIVGRTADDTKICR